MSNEQMRERERRSPLDGLQSVGMAALAGIAGAAILYRNGGADLLSEGVKRAGAVLSAAGNDLTSKALKDIDAETILGSYKKAKTAWEASEGAFKNVVDFRQDAPGDLINIVRRSMEIRNNPRAVLEKIYDSEVIMEGLQNKFVKYAGDDPYAAKRLSDFAEEAFRAPGAFLRNDAGERIPNGKFFADRLDGINLPQGAAEEMANDIMAAMERKQLELESFISERMELNAKMADKLLETDEIARVSGRLGKPGKMDFLLGDRQATIREVLEGVESGKLKTTGTSMKFSGIPAEDFLEVVKAQMEKDESFGDLYASKTIRVDSQGNFRSFKEASNFAVKAAEEFSTTMPGKLLKARSMLQRSKAPVEQFFVSGTASPILASIEGTGSTRLTNSYSYILGKIYRVDGNELTHIKEADNMYLQSGKHGPEVRYIKMMAGDGDARMPGKNKILNSLDVFTSPTPTKWREYSSYATKFSDKRWARNILNDLETQDREAVRSILSSPDSLVDMYDRLDTLNKFFERTTTAMGMSSAKKFRDATGSTAAKEMFGLLEMGDDEMMDRLTSMDERLFKNGKLIQSVRQYKKDATRAMGSIRINSDNAAFMAETRAVKFTESIRKEVAKEGFLSHAAGSGRGYDALVDLFESSGVKGTKLRDAKYLAYSAVFESRDATDLASASGSKTLDMMSRAVSGSHYLFSQSHNADSVFLKDFRKTMGTSIRENASVFQKGFQRMDDDLVVQGTSYGEWMPMRKAISAMDVLRNLNDETRTKAFFKQFTAGRHDMKNVTTATMFPYFAVSRLVDPLNAIGLGFSRRNTGSAMDLTAAIVTKRILPIAGGITALSYLNDSMRSVTGTSLYGAAANSAAAMDIGLRSFADTTGLSGALRTHRALNPISQYNNSDELEYRSAEEQREWYRDGVTPVRKGRWWSFGSFSETRGGKIDYFQPNYLRRAHSNYRDVSIYGSSSEKWAHSWVPTPTHPLAPLRRLMDPYWLERKHYWDRPYPVTGKMFEEGTPWGAVLNPTVGELLKPQIHMHQSELGGTLTDVRDLIAAQNEKVRQKALGTEDLIQIGGLEGGITPVNYTPLGAPSPNEIVLSGKAGKYGAMPMTAAGINYANTVPTAGEYADTWPPIGGGDGKLSLGTSVRVGAAGGGLFSGVFQEAARPLLNIQDLNADIMSRASLPKEGVITADSIFKTKARDIGSVLYNKEAMADLRNISSIGENLQDIAYSAKELSGMYGFIFDEMMPATKQKRLANASRISSFSRAFWDSSIGGRGGDFMEIARRFFPHEDHNIDQINPIRNTMPGWMPGRFQHGDPYAALPKGEMRLPGSGYETLNRLHSDEFGRYGAFDRMKILADIAPSSREYKVWRDIAAKTVDDPSLKAEMKAIRKNVIRQSKAHDFYNYRFLGQELERRSVVIESVDSKGFTVLGDPNRHSFAGIHIDADNTDITKYLQPGMRVDIQTDANKYHARNNSGNISSIVLVGGRNLNKELLDKGLATHKDSESPSAADAQARFTPGQVSRGRVYEAIAHAPIPFVHDKFMRINDPLESYKDEQLYGSSYSTWSHPIKGFVQPMLNKAWAAGPMLQIGTIGLAVASAKASEMDAPAMLRGTITAARAMTNPASFIGATVGYVTKMQGGKLVKLGLNMGAAASVAGYGITRLGNPVSSMMNFGIAGSLLAKQLDLPKIGIDIDPKKGGMIGAVVGLGLSALKNPDFDWDRMTGPWIPKNRQKQWEIEEYYDRLKYIKYMGLYEKASRKALDEEGVDIRRIVNREEYQEKKKEKAKKKLLASRDKVRNSYAEGDTRAAALLAEIDTELEGLTSQTMILRAGKYTKSALAYKQAAESTIYGMGENASIAELLRAVPKGDRDYILEFSKERDPKKQDEILKHMSPYKRRALELAWGREPSKIEDNEKFFARHQLPGMFWAGWQPDVDLDHVEIKTIQNEGMLLSDFGFYDSQAQSAEAQMAPAIDIYQETGGIALKKNLIAALNGAGLIGVDVSVQPSSRPGIQTVANIVRMGNYGVKEALNNTFGRIFY